MVHDLRHVLPGRAALRGSETVLAAGPGPAAPQLGQGQVRGEFPAAVPDRVPGPGGVAGKGDGVPGELGRVAGAVAGADEHAGLPQPGEEILLAAGCRGGGADLPPQRDPRRFLQAAPGRLLRFGPRRAAGGRPVTGRGRPQPVPLLGSQAGIPDPVPLIAEPGTAPVLPGQHRDQVDVVIAVPDRHPADGIVFLAERGQAGTVHHIAGDLRPLIVRQRLVLRRGPHRAMPHRPGEPPRAHRGVRLVQQPEQTPEIPPAVLAQRRLQLGRVPPARDDMRVGVLLPPPGTVQVVDERLDALPARRADLPDHRHAFRNPATGRFHVSGMHSASQPESIPRVRNAFQAGGMHSACHRRAFRISSATASMRSARRKLSAAYGTRSPER